MVEAVKSIFDVSLPVSGTITEVNAMLSKKPELINLDPYRQDWIVKIKLSDSNESSSLLKADEYLKMINK
jgi:glycine cleavage system H protein